VQKNLINKVEKGSLLPDEAVGDFARDAFLQRWSEGSVLLDKDQRSLGLKAVQGKGIDEAVRLSLLHHRELAPALRPRPDGIERPWVLKCKGYPFDIAGQIDVQEEYLIKGPKDVVYSAIRDTKTRTVAPPRNWADTSEAMTLYAMAVKVIDGRIPDEIWLDCLIKGERPRLISLPSKRTEVDFIVAKNRFERACEIIEKGAFTPASRSDWWCSEKFCGFAANGSCRFFNKGNGPKIPVKVKKQEGGRYGREKGTIIPAGSERWWNAIR
jgi:hypothetical protein